MKEIEDIVDSLNQKLYENEDNFSHAFNSIHSGYINAISLSLTFEDYSVEINLWDSENDSRKFNEKTNEYEDLEKHAIQKYKNVLKDMSKITKYLCK